MRALVELDTGEILKEIQDGDKVKVTSKSSMDYLKDNIEVNKGEPFIKIYTKVLFELSRSLTGTESQFVNYLIQHIRYTSGILAYSNGIKLTRQSMCNDTGLTMRSIDRVLDGLAEKQVLGRHKTGQEINFTANPFIFMKGDRINETLFNLFKNTKWARK